METNKLTEHLASVLGDNFNLTLEDIEKEKTQADKEIVYGLICLHEDLQFYKKQGDHLLDNFKTALFSSAAISITNSNGYIKDVNSLFQNLSGYNIDELLGKRLDLIDDENNQSQNYINLKPFIISGKTWRGEVASLTKTGDLFWLDTHIFPIKNMEGHIYEYWSVSTEITKRKQIELELINKNSELEEFTYILSHDLKAPVRQIKQLTKSIEEDFGSEFSEDCKETFELLTSRANKLNSLIDGILDYSRADYKNTEDQLVNLNLLVKDLIDNTEKPNNLKIEILNELPSVRANEVKMDQIFENLIGNAIKYMDKPNGLIKIKVDDTASDLYRFEISDNGPGIEEKFLETIFNVFVTAHGSQRSDSTGIGLAVTKKIINAYGGQIGCNSVVSKGSTFWFTWPKII
jgi:PAS domain S-box-containing protein